MRGPSRVRERLWSLEKDDVVVHAELQQYRSGRFELRLLTGHRMFARSHHDGVIRALTLSNLVCRDLRQDGWRVESS